MFWRKEATRVSNTSQESKKVHLSPSYRVENAKVEIPTVSELISELKKEELSNEEELAKYLEDNTNDILDDIIQDIKRMASLGYLVGFVEYEKHFDYLDIKDYIKGDGKLVYPPYKEYLSRRHVGYSADTIKYAWVEHNKEEFERKGYAVTFSGNSAIYGRLKLELSWGKGNE